MNDIPAIAWVIIVFILLLTIGLNYSLYHAYKLRSKNSGDQKSLIQKFGDGLRGPFQTEEKDLQELSHLVAKMRSTEQKSDSSNHTANEKNP